ncbi:MAG: Grx4 family monothiol glutaredoxin [Pseudomonadota bacterium]
MSTIDIIKSQIAENPIILYMKGTPQFPQCGFSARTVELLTQYDEPFAFVNILEHPDIRGELPKYAQWPTFPQLWVNQELVGGCDIVVELAQRGELESLIKGARQQSNASTEFTAPNAEPANTK